MSTLAERLTFTPGDYLVWEATQTENTKYFHGKVSAMTGTTDRHNEILLNCAVALRPHLYGTHWRLHAIDVKLCIEAVDAYFHPDLFLTDSAADHADRHVKRAACVVIEILSPATAAYDLGAKFAAYRQLPSLHEYVLIDPDAVSVNVFRRGEDGQWVLWPYADGETVELPSIGLHVPVAEIYVGTEAM